MNEKENKPKHQLSCLQQGPGPAYQLPSLIGYIKHDPSRRREPAYSMKFSKHASRTGDGPGPKYKVDGFTYRGPEKSPAYSIGQKKSPQNADSGPSPMDYAAEKCPLINHNRRPPAFSLRIRDSKMTEAEGPGPIYSLPSCLGPKVVDKKAEGAFTIGNPAKQSRSDDIPGPGAYKTDNFDVVKRKYPAYSLKFRPKDLGKWDGPGPKYKSEFYSGRRPPMYSFGLKHSQCAGTPMTEADDE